MSTLEGFLRAESTFQEEATVTEETAVPLTFEPLTITPYNLAETSMDRTSCYKKLISEGEEVEKDFNPSSIRKVPDRIPFLMKLVDSEYNTAGISIPSKYIITGIKLSPNPINLSINSSKLITRYNTMTRWVEEHWGDEIDNVLFSGSSFSFFGYELPGYNNTGLTVGNRNRTKAYAMIKELARFFKNNGMIFQDNKTYDGMDISGSPTNKFINDDTNFSFVNNHPLQGVAKERLYVNIFFDYVSLLGYFESFDIIEESANPYRFTYNCVFKAERTKYHQGKTALSYAGDNG